MRGSYNQNKLYEKNVFNKRNLLVEKSKCPYLVYMVLHILLNPICNCYLALWHEHVFN